MVNEDSAREQLLETIRSIEFQTLVNLVLVVLAAYLLGIIITKVISKISEKMSRSSRIKGKMIIPIIKVGIYATAFFYILRQIFKILGPEIFLLSGLVGAAIGFGVKDLFADYVGGIIITFERPYHVGDKIAIGDYYGEVTDIGLRETKLVTPDDNVVTAPNSLIFKEAVASGNYGSPGMMVVIDLFIASESDVKIAMKILRETVVSSKYVYISEKNPVIMLHKALPFYTRLRAKAYVNDLRDEFEFESDVHTRAWIEFKNKGIQAPQLHILNIPQTGEEPEIGTTIRRSTRLDKRSRGDSESGTSSQRSSEL